MSELENNEEKEFDDFLNMLDSVGDGDDNIDYTDLMNLLGVNFDELEEEFKKQSVTIDVKFKKSNVDATTPEYAYPTDSGFDLCSTEECLILPFDRKLVPTGIHIDIPENYEVQIRSKSGLALKQGLMVLNSPGTIDQGYTGEIQVILFNASKDKVKIEKGQKVAQAVLCPVVAGKWVNLVEDEDLDSKDRSDNGFGSTGI
jgi:dUTP pyrophosphatase